jgi:DNA-binding transcriptional LysR family regulator
MELRHLRYFLAVAEHQGFRKAAQSLRVSHPSLCEQIIDLETEIGTRLFERTNHHVSLTAAGHTFVAGARKTLRCALQAVEMAQKASREYRGELRIANVGLICPSILAQLISGFRGRYPKVEVSILQQNSFKWVEGAHRRAELGIGYLSASRPVGALRSSVIATAPVGIAVAATVKHDHQGPATIVDFTREPFLILDPKYAPGYLEWTRSIFLQTGFKPAKTILVDSAEALFTLIGAGVGVGLLSPLHFGAQSVGVSFRKLAESVADFPLSLVWNPERGGPLVNGFLTMARQVLPKQEGILRLATHSRGVASQVLA